MTFRKDLIAGGGLLTFDVIYFLLSFQIEPHRGIGATPMDNRAVPWLYATLLALLGILLLIRGLRGYRAEKQTGSYENLTATVIKRMIIDKKAVILTFVMLTVYFALLESVGFVVMTFLFLFGAFYCLYPIGKKKNYILMTIVAAFFAIGIYYAFGEGLNVMLPQGLWPLG